MRHVRFAAAVGIACLAGTAAQSATLQSRIVINDEAGVAAAKAIGAQYDSVVELRFYADATFTGGFGLCTGSLISSTTILTAQHCVPGTQASQVQVRFTDGDGNLQFARTVSAIDLMPGYTFLSDGTDVATLTLADPVLDRTPFQITSDIVTGELARMVGYGLNGLGSTGHQNSRDGARWGAENVIDLDLPGQAYSGPNLLYFSDFDNPDGTSNTLLDVFGVPSLSDMLANEGTTAGGDSGGPLLVQRNGEWVIAAVLSGGVGGQGLPQFSEYGDISFWTAIHSDAARQLVIDGGGVFYEPGFAEIPLPASGALLLGALGMVGMLRRRRTTV